VKQAPRLLINYPVRGWMWCFVPHCCVLNRSKAINRLFEAQ